MMSRGVSLKITPVLILALLIVVLFAPISHAAALNYDPSYLMDDVVFTNASSMSEQSIQNFLSSEGSYLAGYQDTENCTPKFNVGNYDSTSFYNSHYKCGQSESAAQIIYDTSQAYGINPQVILATLQKEEGLITDPSPSASQIYNAMGYGCSDSGGCNSSNSGFFMQVDDATWQFKADMTLMSGQGWWGYSPNSYPCSGPTNYYSTGLYPNNTVTFYDDNGTAYSTLTLQSASTATLYCYTPHTYNNPQGINGVPQYGTTGLYYSGSYNFEQYFKLWFGSTTTIYNIFYQWHQLGVSSNGNTASIPVVLTKPPTSPVQIVFGVSDSSRASIFRNQSLFFNQSNWNIPQSVVVQGLASNQSSSGFYLQVQQVISGDGHYSQQPLGYYSKLPLFWQNSSERAVYRLYNSGTNQHAYTSSVSQENYYLNNGYVLESIPFYQCDSGDGALDVSTNGSIVASPNDPSVNNLEVSYQTQFFPGILFSNTSQQVGVYLLQRFSSPGYPVDTLLTTSSAEASQAISQNGFQSVAFFYGCSQSNYPVYRLYNPSDGDHFYTTDPNERSFALRSGYLNEDAQFYLGGNVVEPVYRLFNPVTGDHFYTISSSEVSGAEGAGYRYEGQQFTLGSTAQPVYRLFNSNTGDHFYTTSSSEVGFAEQAGYKSEGVVFTLP